MSSHGPPHCTRPVQQSRTYFRPHEKAKKEGDEHGDEVAGQTRLMRVGGVCVCVDGAQLLLSEEVRGVDVPLLGAGAWV